MHAILNQTTTQDTPRNLRGRSKIGMNGAKHSPDGYFTHDWRGYNTPEVPNFLNRRSKSHIVSADSEPQALQDVQEEGDDSNVSHPWHRPSRYDSRSPCPALNVAANHGYLPRDGRNLSVWAIIKALRECYGVSWVLAIVFTVGSFIILRVGGVGKGWLYPTIDLEDLAVHGVLEHNGSLTHFDIDEDDSRSPARSRSVSSSSSTAISASAAPSRFSLPSILSRKRERRTAPSRASRTLLRALLADSASGTHFTLQDVARARVRRKATTGPTPAHLSQFADAEFALTVGIFSADPRNPKVKLEMLREWLEDERLPRGWKPSHEQGFWQNHLNTTKVQLMMVALQKYKEKTRNLRTVSFE